MILSRLYLSAGTHNHTSAPRLVGIAHALHTVNKATGRKIRIQHKIFVLQMSDTGIYQLVEIMR